MENQCRGLAVPHGNPSQSSWVQPNQSLPTTEVSGTPVLAAGQGSAAWISFWLSLHQTLRLLVFTLLLMKSLFVYFFSTPQTLSTSFFSSCCFSSSLSLQVCAFWGSIYIGSLHEWLKKEQRQTCGLSVIKSSLFSVCGPRPFCLFFALESLRTFIQSWDVPIS